ncbi:6-phosphogluconolactonase, partial [Pseudomonas syringae]|nr:6-phosphogluconolactonase [Pseudomonas syringae]
MPTEHADSNARLLPRHLLQGPASKAQFLCLFSVSS